MKPFNPYPFFRELAVNNDRTWFAANKARYEQLRSQWTEGMEDVRRQVAGVWSQVAYTDIKTFRIYRDTRFSNNKTPYKTHIGSVIAPPHARDVHSAGVYIECGIPETDSGVFGGMWAPETAVLKKLRKAIVDNIEEWEEIVHDPALNALFPEWFGERLKTAPQGWPKDHPQIEYLRLKHLGRYSAMTPAMYNSSHWTSLIAERVSAIVPLIRFLDYSVNEE